MNKKDKMKKKDKKKLAVRIVCLSLAGIMVASLAYTLIYFIVSAL